MRNTLRRSVTYAGAALALMIGMHAVGLPRVQQGSAIESREPTALAFREDRGTALCGRCGDGACVPSCGETPASCPRDCGVPSESLCGRCGDGACVRQCGETPTSCPRDCAPAGETLRVE